LGGDLVVYSMTGMEELAHLFEFNLELLSFKADIDFKKIVGQRVTVTLDLDKGERHFNGYVTQFRYTGNTARYSTYEATVRPWLWFLTRTADCRVFQKGIDGIKTVPDIIKAVFRDNGMSDFDDRLSGTYRDWIYCVQYRETDFNFVSRLMEQEGIYYYFEHEKGKHTMVLADDLSAHKPFPGHEKAPYFPPSGMSVQTKDHIELWNLTQSIQPGKYAIAEYDFEKPKVELLSRLGKTREFDYAIKDPEIFDYPGQYKDSGDGDHYVKLRLHELQTQHERVQGGGPIRTLAAGSLFTLEDHPRRDQNKEYLTISVSHRMTDGEYISGGGESVELYRCEMEVMDKNEPFRPARKSPKPVVQGCHSAVVVGPENEEIFTDKYGRVKVQFHWDRYGKNDENSSCWVRVSQAWAGKDWGSMHIPRIGHEVLVSFMEGDPDRPIITGRVYNAENMPPYKLEANKTQSGIKSRSSKDGSSDNFNEIRMEDKKGEEELYFHAEKNHTNITENDRNDNVGHNYSLTVQNDYMVNVGYEVGDQGNYTLNVHQHRFENVSNGDYNLGVDTGNRTTYVKTDDTVEVLGSRKEIVTNTLGSQAKDIKMKGTATLKANSPDIDINGSTKTKIGSAAIEVVGNTVKISGKAEILLSVGGSSIKLDPSGVTIVGPLVKIN
jgi:type VI secretion system secreted protein VgrG